MVNHVAGMIRGQAIIKDKLDVLMKRLTRQLNRHFTVPEEISNTMQDLQAGQEFSHRLTSSVSNVIRDITDGILVNLGNTVLLRRDSYLEGLKPGVSQDNLAKLKAGPFNTETLFEETSITRAESDIRLLEAKPRSVPEKKERSTSRYQPYPASKTREDTGSRRSDWRRFSKRKSNSNTPKVKSQVSKPARGSQQSK